MKSLRDIAHTAFAGLRGGCLSLLIFPLLATAQNPVRTQALQLESAGQTAPAEQAWQSILQADPKNAEALAHLGLLEARQSRFPQAIGFYKQALALQPDTPGLRINLGLALFKNAQFADALGPFTAEYKKNPADARLVVLLGMSHYGLGDYLVAIPYLQRGAQQQPGSLPLRLALAHSCLWSRQFECVKATYKEILTINPGSAEAEMLVGEALDETGDDLAAMEHFRLAIAANPKEPNVHFGLGYLLWTQNHYSEAADEFQQEIAHDSAHSQAQIFLGDSYVQLNRLPEAETTLIAALKLEPRSEIAHRDLGIVKADTGDLPQAEAELKQAIALDAMDSAAHYRLGRVLKAEGKQAEAAAEFKLVNEMKQRTNDALIHRMQAADATARPAP